MRALCKQRIDNPPTMWHDEGNGRSKLFAEGQKYRSNCDASGNDGREYEYFPLLRQVGTLVHVQDGNGKVSVINRATPRFIRADPWR
jgi:hypothetical protein